MDEKRPTWERIRTRAGPDLKLFRVRFDWKRNPRNGRTMRAIVLEAPDWVNVVALTAEGKAVVVRQHRHGVGQVTTEIPAGIVEGGEDSRETAVRELREETGYTTDDWEYLGYVEPNPAFLNNQCHHWLARNAARTDPVELDDGEDIVVGEMSLAELRQEMEAGRLRHSLALVALARVFNLWERR
jgi:8-oxo-dGTP pyrophosphatase MutT (NUDIX family)